MAATVREPSFDPVVDPFFPSCRAPEPRFCHPIPADGGLSYIIGCACTGGDVPEVEQRARPAGARVPFYNSEGWLNLRWRKDNGKEYLRVDGHTVVVFPAGKVWVYTLDGSQSAAAFPTAEAAKLSACRELNYLAANKQRKGNTYDDHD